MMLIHPASPASFYRPSHGGYLGTVPQESLVTWDIDQDPNGTYP